MKRKMEELTQLPEARGCGEGPDCFFSRKHADEKNSCHRSDNRADYRQDMAFFFNLRKWSAC